MTMEWEEVGVQHKLIGGSTLGILMGQASYGGKIQEVYDWIVHGITGFQGNAYTDRGNKYEPVVRKLFLEKTGAVILPHPGLLLMEDCFAANLDDIAQRGAVFPVDYKTASNSKSNMAKWGPDGSSQFPKQYSWQLRLYMVMLDRVLGIKTDHAELFTAFGTDVKDENGNFTGEFDITDCRRYFLERDQSLEEQGLEVGRKFWRNHIIPKIPPTTPEEPLSVKLSAEDMAFFDLCMTGTAPEPAAPAFTPPAPPSNAPVVQPPQKPAANSEDVRAGDCVTGTFYKLPGGAIGKFTGTSREFAFFEVGDDPDAPGSSVRLPSIGLVQKTKVTTTPPLVAPATEPAPVLSPDTPASIPELAANCPHCPPLKTGKPAQHMLADCPTLKKVAEPTAETKKPRGRPRKMEIVAAPSETKPDPVLLPPNKPAPITTDAQELVVQTAKVAEAKASGSQLTTTEKIAALDAGVPSAKVMTSPDANGVRSLAPAPPEPARRLILYVNCEPRSGPRPERLEGYVSMLVSGLATLCSVGDIRSSDDKRLGFGKWRGALADAAKQNPPSGVFQISTADSDFASIVVEALTPLCVLGWPVHGSR